MHKSTYKSVEFPNVEFPNLCRMLFLELIFEWNSNVEAIAPECIENDFLALQRYKMNAFFKEGF